MAYAWDNNDSLNFGKYYALYYKTAYGRSLYNINSMSWRLVEQNITDYREIEAAVRTMKYDIEHYDQYDPDAWDTYANLLFKAGKKADAIAWESKALKQQPDRPEFKTTLERMQNGSK